MATTQEKSFSKQSGSTYFGYVTFTPPTANQQGDFFCEVLNTSSLEYYLLHKRNVSVLKSSKYQQMFNILGHDTNQYALLGPQLAIDLPATPGVQVIVVQREFETTDERLTTLAKLWQKQVNHLNAQLTALKQDIGALKGHIVHPNRVILRVMKRYWKEHQYCYAEPVVLVREGSGWAWKNQSATGDKWLTDVTSSDGRTVNMKLWGQSISYTTPAADWRQLSSHDILIETVQHPWQ